MQDPADAGAVPAVQQLFGVETQSRLVCEESGEAIEESGTIFELKWVQLSRTCSTKNISIYS